MKLFIHVGYFAGVAGIKGGNGVPTISSVEPERYQEAKKYYQMEQIWQENGLKFIDQAYAEIPNNLSLTKLYRKYDRYLEFDVDQENLTVKFVGVTKDVGLQSEVVKEKENEKHTKKKKKHKVHNKHHEKNKHENEKQENEKPKVRKPRIKNEDRLESESEKEEEKQKKVVRRKIKRVKEKKKPIKEQGSIVFDEQKKEEKVNKKEKNRCGFFEQNNELLNRRLMQKKTFLVELLSAMQPEGKFIDNAIVTNDGETVSGAENIKGGHFPDLVYRQLKEIFEGSLVESMDELFNVNEISFLDNIIKRIYNEVFRSGLFQDPISQDLVKSKNLLVDLNGHPISQSTLQQLGGKNPWAQMQPYNDEPISYGFGQCFLGQLDVKKEQWLHEEFGGCLEEKIKHLEQDPNIDLMATVVRSRLEENSEEEKSSSSDLEMKN